MALSSTGYRASQLTRPGHGFSDSPFGIRYLNPLWTNVEDRFIDERVTIQGDNAASALAILRARLAANRVVIITVYSMAHKFVEVPFFHHSIRLPTGPMRLMRETGAPLLPACVFANDDGHFDVTIESALPSSDKQGAFDSTARPYAKLLESYVRKYPEQWGGWEYFLPKC
jgi:lauroyl/myristoyl acyltransferase